MKQIATLLLVLLASATQMVWAQQNYYDLYSGNGYGLRFWGGNDAFKIHMGNSSEYLYGPVSDYSIKMNMSGESGRGWTWGIAGATPAAAINTTGRMQLAQTLIVGPYNGNGSSGRIGATGDGAEISLSNRAVSSFVENPTMGERWVIYNNGTSSDGKLRFWSGGDRFAITKEGNVGIGTTFPDQKLSIAGNLSFTGDSPVLYTGTGGSELNRYLQLINSTSFSSASGLKAGGILVADTYAYANPSKNDLIVKGNVGIGTASPNQKLTVNGTIYGKEVKVDLSVPGPDYVFEKSYSLPTLEQVKSYIEENKHLPEVPSAAEMEKNGINLSEMNMLLLKKVEELTLYVIELKKDIENIKSSKK